VHPLGRALTCDRCHVQLRNAVYELRAEQGRIVRCLRCSLLYRPMLRRSLIIGLIVGTILTAINQGNLIAQGTFPAVLAWKIPLTYCVPFFVATTGALLNARAVRNAEG
jgi:hypothetical protein